MLLIHNTSTLMGKAVKPTDRWHQHCKGNEMICPDLLASRGMLNQTQPANNCSNWAWKHCCHLPWVMAESVMRL